MRNLCSSGKDVGGSRVRRFLLMASLLIVVFMLSCNNPLDQGTTDPDTEWRPVNINAVGRTEDDNEVLVYQTGQLDRFFTRMDMVEMAPDSGSYRAKLYFKDMKPADIPNTGDVIASYPTEMAEYGFLYKVLGVSTEANGVTVVEVRTAALQEAFEDVEYEAEIEILFDEEGNVIGALAKTLKASNWLRGVGNFFKGVGNAIIGVTQAIGEAVFLLVLGDYTTDRDFSNSLKRSANFALDSDVNIKAEVDFSLTFYFSLEVRRWDIKYAKISLKADGEMGLGSNLRNPNATGAIDRTALERVFTRDLGTITIMVGPVPVVITNDFVVELYAGMKAESKKEMAFRFVGGCEFGFTYWDERWNEINRNTFRPNLDGTTYQNGEITFGIAMGVESKIYNTVGMKAVAGPGLAFTTVANPTGIHIVEEIPNQEVTLDFVVRYYVAATLSRWASSLAYSVGIGNREFGKDQTWNWILAQGDLYRTQIFKRDILPHVLPNPHHTQPNSNEIIFFNNFFRDPLNYPAQEYGYCIETPNSGECKQGGGIIKRFNLTPETVPTWTRETLTATFDPYSDLPLPLHGAYHVRPYFKNTLGGTYYYDAIEVEAIGRQLGVPSSISLSTPMFVYSGSWTDESEVNTLTTNIGSLSYSPRGKMRGNKEYYAPGTQITVTVTPAEGHVFLGWRHDDKLLDKTVTITMDNDRYLPQPIIGRLPIVTTAVTPASSGTVSLTPEGSAITIGTDLAHYYPLETQVTATPTPAEGYEFSEWTQTFTPGGPRTSPVRSTSRTSVMTIKMDNYEDSYTLTANFRRVYRLTTNANPTVGGTVSVNNERENYAAGTQLTITATPAEGYVFTGWQGASTSAQRTLLFTTADSDQILTATFARSYTLTTNTAPAVGGTVSYTSLPGQISFVDGTNVTITATPSSGYVFTGWSGASTSTNPVVTVTMNSDRTLTANFLRLYHLNIRNEGRIIGGNVSRSPNQTNYIDGTQVTVTATPVRNYEFAGWSGASMSTNPIITITMDSDKLLEAKFVRTYVDPDKIFTDPRDGQQYRTTKIGTQTWMAENLKYDNFKFPNGYWERYGYDSNYGMLYFSDDAADVCPPGWHLPSRSEWELLIAAVGAGANTASQLKAESGWGTNNGTDNYDFTALPGGYAAHYFSGSPVTGNVTIDTGNNAYWWAGGGGRHVVSTAGDDANGIAVYPPADILTPIDWQNAALLNVRCVQDITP